MKYSEALRILEQLGDLAPWRGQTWSGSTEVMAPGLAAGSTVAAFRYPSGAVEKILLKWMHLHYVCHGTFTTPITATRRLALMRGWGGDPVGGVPLSFSRDQSSPKAETLLSGRIATTVALTMTGVEYEPAPRATLLLSHVGTAGLDYDEIWSWEDPYSLLPGELCGIVAPATFDAVGTWQLSWKGGAVEVPQ